MSTYKDLLKDITVPSYVIYRGGLGIDIYYRRNYNKSKIEKFIMHPDNYGQYVVDDRPALYEFLEGYAYLGECNM